MKDISIYFQHVENTNKLLKESIGNIIISNKENDFPEIAQPGVAIFTVPEYRNAIDIKEQQQEKGFRKQFYNLTSGVNWKHTIYDLGNILPGETIEDTLYAIRVVCSELIKKNVLPFIIGGTQELTKGLFDAYSTLEQLINVTSIDNRLDFDAPEASITPKNWIGHILFQEPNYLFNYANIGSQSHYTSPKTLKLFEEMYFDVYRLGNIHNDIQLAEPCMRNTDLLSVDLTSIRASEFQNKEYSSPNGLFAHELCALMRYAGISDKLTSVGIFNYYGNNEDITDEIVAQLIWYFNEGFAQRKEDFPIGSKKEYTRFRVYLENIQEEIVFYKSNKSERWWIEVPYPSTSKSSYMRHQMVPCSYNTYQEAMKGEIPNLWWKTYQKFAL